MKGGRYGDCTMASEWELAEWEKIKLISYWKVTGHKNSGNLGTKESRADFFF